MNLSNNMLKRFKLYVIAQSGFSVLFHSPIISRPKYVSFLHSVDQMKKLSKFGVLSLRNIR